jgi:DNA-directed RNA polymerase subunit RPC12/RpoP
VSNDQMMDDLIRLRCPACGTRMDLPARTTYAACRHCGSEYLVERRRGAWTLQPLTPEELALSQEVAAVEHRQEMGCANAAMSILAFFTVFFCLIGVAGWCATRNSWISLVTWLIAFALFVPLAIAMLRNVERGRVRRERLLARKAALAPDLDAAADLAPPGGAAPEPPGPPVVEDAPP